MHNIHSHPSTQEPSSLLTTFCRPSHITQQVFETEVGGLCLWVGWYRKEAVPVARPLSTAASMTLWHGSMVMSLSVRCLPLYREHFPTLSDHRALFTRLSCPVF